MHLTHLTLAAIPSTYVANQLLGPSSQLSWEAIAMGKVRDKMDAAIREKRTFFSFEFFPPRTPEVSRPMIMLQLHELICCAWISSTSGSTLRSGGLLQSSN